MADTALFSIVPIIHQCREVGKYYAQNTHSNSAKVNAKPPGVIRLLNQDDRSSIYKKSLRVAHDQVTTGLCIAFGSSANSAGDRHFLLCLIGVRSFSLTLAFIGLGQVETGNL